ncbi:hypothetical protein SAMN05444170_4333 [Bradyrhizobium erythrophlei]|uniref:Uncharacterized protein n=1 Tax=Bradyrhizobium erythrophlei TaxID=1437360 RepID=A0A1M7UBS9_9BRAD|nr:hypothetical protein SAMN05444170_4333 [Bradyrhizobium erythrophlei]
MLFFYLPIIMFGAMFGAKDKKPEADKIHAD